MSTESTGKECNAELDRVIRERRTVRSFAGGELGRETVESLLEAGRLAPYASIAVDDPLFRRFVVLPAGGEALRRAEEIIRARMGMRLEMLKAQMEKDEAFRQKAQKWVGRIEALSGGADVGFAGVSCYIIVAEMRGFPPVEERSLAHVMQNMWLKATALGLGFRLLSVTTMMADDEEFCSLLGLPAGKFAFDGCVIGNPKAVPAPPERAALDEITTWLD
jgi:nitroreductase